MRELSRLKIVSDGNALNNSRVEVDGKILPCVKAVITIEAGHLTTAVITVDDVEVVVDGEFERQQHEYVSTL